MHLVALHPNMLEILGQAIHEVTGLLFDTPEVPDGPKQSRKEHPNILKLFAWVEVYGRGIILEKDVDVMRTQLQKIVDIVTARIEGDSDKLEEILVTVLSHGQRMELREEEEVEERRRKKGKYKVEEDVPHNTMKEPPPSSTKQATTSRIHQWRTTFTMNVINILVCDLIHKIKDPEYGASSEMKKDQEQAFEA
eukprot:Gb_29262 [translate_table: standard]